MTENQTRIVITGLGQISALGNTIEQLSEALDSQQSGIRTLEQIPYEHLIASYGGEAWDFTGNIDNYDQGKTDNLENDQTDNKFSKKRKSILDRFGEKLKEFLDNA